MTLIDPGTRAGDLDRALAALDRTLEDAGRVALDAGSIRDERPGASGFLFVASGRVTVRTDGPRPLVLDAGDLVVFPRELDRRVRAETDAVLVHAGFARTSGPRVALDALPDTVVASGFAAREPAMAVLLDGVQGGGFPRIGDAVICSRITSMIVSVAIRAWVEQGCATARWAQRASDPHIGRALDELHADLDRAWTVEDLARVAAMSRSAFAARFREVVGRSPATYLAAARVDAGMELLADGALTVSDIALRLGYESEAGFSRAFRRHTGSTPALWRSHRTIATPDIASVSTASVRPAV